MNCFPARKKYQNAYFMKVYDVYEAVTCDPEERQPIGR